MTAVLLPLLTATQGGFSLEKVKNQIDIFPRIRYNRRSTFILILMHRKGHFMNIAVAQSGSLHVPLTLLWLGYSVRH